MIVCNILSLYYVPCNSLKYIYTELNAVLYINVSIMVLELDGNSEQFVHVGKNKSFKKIKFVSTAFQPKRTPYTDQITDFTTNVRTYF